MKRTLIIYALFGCAALASPSVLAAESMTSATCQPLSSANIEGCCAATGWRDIILPGEYRYCPPLDASDKNSGRIGEVMAGNGNEVPGTDPVNTGSIDTPDTPDSVGGNPGNVKDVGDAGEKGKDNESPSTGTQGDSN
ncbi:MAG TPA: hypothetical protein VM144_13415 [Aestuariivirga sp.]|nr:hypothetical protein [Aestuariivirga sp.]